MNLTILPTRHDEQEALEAIEVVSFEDFWDAKKINDELVPIYQTGLTVRLNGEIVGYVIYRMHDNGIEIKRMVVSPEYRNRAVGASIIEKLMGKLSLNKRQVLFAKVPDDNLGMHLFLKKMKFIGKPLDENTYFFFYRIHPENH